MPGWRTFDAVEMLFLPLVCSSYLCVLLPLQSLDYSDDEEEQDAKKKKRQGSKKKKNENGGLAHAHTHTHSHNI